jgi:sulfur transfer protein SufE
MSHSNCLLKQERLKKLFASCPDRETKYRQLIELGKTLPPLNPAQKKQENLVSGCQSRLYLYADLNEMGNMVFQADSEALISAGLAALLITVYNDELPETVLQCPPAFIDELGILESLSPGRSNGLLSLHLRMKQEAIKYILVKS